MSRYSITGHPLMLGFEQVERILERASKSGSDSYPPYNIELTGENAYRISLAVAGFSEDDIAITVEDGNHLVIRGDTPSGDGEREFLHRGIATRRFEKSFVLAEGVEVGGARMANGLLAIDLRRSSDVAEVKRIAICRD